MTAGGKVIGCVWGAHRTLIEELGDDSPTYDWCEAAWLAYGLGRLLPVPVDTEKLVAHLRVFWANGWRRDPGPQLGQLTLWEAS